MKWREATFQKMFQNNDMKMIQDLEKRMQKTPRNVYQRSRNTKAQANKDEQHSEGINSRKQLRAEENGQADLEDRMVEITA